MAVIPFRPPFVPLQPSLETWLDYARPIITAALGETKAEDLLRFPTAMSQQSPAPTLDVDLVTREIKEYLTGDAGGLGGATIASAELYQFVRWLTTKYATRPSA